jgi:shikimate 5-dehydrogenase
MTETAIAQLGLGGAALAIVFWFMRWMCQHLDKNNKTLDDLSAVIAENKATIQKNTQITSELVTYFKALNGKIIPKG